MWGWGVVVLGVVVSLVGLLPFVTWVFSGPVCVGGVKVDLFIVVCLLLFWIFNLFWYVVGMMVLWSLMVLVKFFVGSLACVVAGVVECCFSAVVVQFVGH